MNFKTILKVISAIVAIAGVAVAVYLAIQKLTAPKEAEYFDDSDSGDRRDRRCGHPGAGKGRAG